MEMLQKPRVVYAHVFAEKQEAKNMPGTVAWLIWKYIKEKELPGRRPMGLSQKYTLKLVARSPIGAVMAADLRPSHFIDHCAARIASGVKPATTKQDMTYLRVVLNYAEDTWEIPGVNLKAYKKAKKQLVREQLIGKSEPRTRLPEDEESDLLRVYFIDQMRDPRTKIDMPLMHEAELKTGRRVSELTRIERQHVNVSERTYMIYNLKNSKGKGYHGEAALIEGAWELFEQRLAVIPNKPTARLFPFNPHSVSAKYSAACKALGIQNLQMRDNRAECFVTLLEKGYSVIQVRKGVSLHTDDSKVLEQTYLRIKAKDLHRGPASKFGVEKRLS